MIYIYIDMDIMGDTIPLTKDLLQNSGNQLSSTITIVAYMQNMESNHTQKEHQHDSFTVRINWKSWW